MTWVEVVARVGDWVLLVASVGVLTFTISYGVRSNWRVYPEGRAVFWLAVALSSLTLLVFWAVIDRLTGWDTGDARTVFRAVAYATVAAASWRLVVTVWKAQRSERNGSR